MDVPAEVEILEKAEKEALLSYEETESTLRKADSGFPSAPALTAVNVSSC